MEYTNVECCIIVALNNHHIIPKLILRHIAIVGHFDGNSF